MSIQFPAHPSRFGHDPHLTVLFHIVSCCFLLDYVEYFEWFMEFALLAFLWVSVSVISMHFLHLVCVCIVVVFTKFCLIFCSYCLYMSYLYWEVHYLFIIWSLRYYQNDIGVCFIYLVVLITVLLTFVIQIL